MKNSQKGSVLTVIVILIIIVSLVSTYYFLNKKQAEELVLNTVATTTVSSELKPETKMEETYAFSEFVQPNQNMDYKLKKLSDVDYELNIDGFQTLMRIKAHSKMAGHDSANLIFDSYTEVNTPNIFKEGDVLFTFTSGDTDETLIVLKWVRLKPLDPQNDKTAVFNRVK